MRSTSVGRVGRATGIPTATDVKKISPWSRQTERPCVSGIEPKITARPNSVQKLRPASQIVVAKPIPSISEPPSTPNRSTTPTSLNRSSSAQRTRTSSIQSIFVKPSAPGTPVPIEQRSKFSTTRATPSKADSASISSGSPLGQTPITPIRSRTPSRTGVSGASSIGSLKAMVGPYSFFLKELKKEKNMYLRDESKEKDLRTIMNQLTLFRLLLDKKLSEDRSSEEKLLLIAWQLVYDAEEEAFGLKSKERIALEINKIHGQLIDMVTIWIATYTDIINVMFLKDARIAQVNNVLAPVFEKLNTYVNLRMAQVEAKEEVVENSSFIRSVTAKMSASREYSAAILNLEKAVRVLERMVEKRDRLLNTSIKSQAVKLNSSSSNELSGSGQISPKGDNNISPLPSPKRSTVIPPNATVPIAPRHFMAPTDSFRIKVTTPADKESEGVHSVHDKTLSSTKKLGSAHNLKGLGGSFFPNTEAPTTPLKSAPSMVRVNSSNSLNKLATPKSMATTSSTSTSMESPLKKAPSISRAASVSKMSPMPRGSSGIPVHFPRAQPVAAVVPVVAAVPAVVAAAPKTLIGRKQSFLSDLPDVTIVEDEDDDSDEEVEVEEVRDILQNSKTASDVSLRIDTSSSLSPKVPAPSRELVRTMSDMPRTNSGSKPNSRPGSANGTAPKSPGQLVTRTASAATFDDFAKLAKSPTLPRTASSTFDDFASKLASLENLGFASYAAPVPIVKPQVTKSSVTTTVTPAVKTEVPAPQAPPSTKSVAADFLAKRRAAMNAEQIQESAVAIPVVTPVEVSVVVPASIVEQVTKDDSNNAHVVDIVKAEETHAPTSVAQSSLSPVEDELRGASIVHDFSIQAPIAEVVSTYGGVTDASVALSKSLEQLSVVSSPPRSPSTPFFTLSRGSSFREVQPRSDAVNSSSSTPSLPPPSFEDAINFESSESVSVDSSNSLPQVLVACVVDEVPPPAFDDVVGEKAFPAEVPHNQPSFVSEVVNENVSVAAPVTPPAAPVIDASVSSNGNGSAYSAFFNKKAVVESEASVVVNETLPIVAAKQQEVTSVEIKPVVVAAPAKSAYSSFLAKKSPTTPITTVSYTESYHAPVQSLEEAQSNLTVRTTFSEDVAEVSPEVTPLAAQAITASTSTKSAYAAFLSKKAPSVAQVKSDFSYTEDSYVAPPVEVDVSVVQTSSVTHKEAVVAVSIETEAERLVASKTAYSDFLSKKGDTTPTTRTDISFSAVEHENVLSQSVTHVETAPPRVVSTKSAYSDFLARKPSPQRDQMSSAAPAFSYTVDTYIAPSTPIEHPVVVVETKEELAACAKAVEALAASPVSSSVYGDFLKKRSVRTDPVVSADLKGESASVSDLQTIEETPVSVVSAPQQITSVPTTPTKNAYSSFLNKKASFREVSSNNSSFNYSETTPTSTSPVFGSSVSPTNSDTKKAMSAQSAYNSFLKKTSSREASSDDVGLDIPRVASPVALDDLVVKSSGVLVKKTSFREVVHDTSAVEIVETSSSKLIVTEAINTVVLENEIRVETNDVHIERHIVNSDVVETHNIPQAPQQTVVQQPAPVEKVIPTPAAPLSLEEKIALALGGASQPVVMTEIKQVVNEEKEVFVEHESNTTIAHESQVGVDKLESIETDFSAGTALTGIASYSPADHVDTQSVQSIDSFEQSPSRVHGLPPLKQQQRPSITSESASVDLNGDPHKTPKKNSMHKFLSKTFSVSSSSKKDKKSDSFDLSDIPVVHDGSAKGSIDGSVHGNNNNNTSSISMTLPEDSVMSPDPKKPKSTVSMFKKSLFGSSKKKT